MKRLHVGPGLAAAIVKHENLPIKFYLANPVDRCFFCKTNLYDCIARHADARSFKAGPDLDDLGEYQPGSTPPTSLRTPPLSRS